MLIKKLLSTCCLEECCHTDNDWVCLSLIYMYNVTVCYSVYYELKSVCRFPGVILHMVKKKKRELCKVLSCSRGSWAESDKSPHGMLLESALVWAEDWKRFLQPTPHLCLMLKVQCNISLYSITPTKLSSCIVGNGGYWQNMTPPVRLYRSSEFSSVTEMQC